MMSASTTIPESSSLVGRLPALKSGIRRVFLLRHGETDWNLQGRVQGGGFDIVLNENGLSQAKMAANELKSVPFEVVASSTLKRASKTADIIFRHHESTARRVEMNGFNEMRFGEFEGKLMRESTEESKRVMKKFQKYNARMRQDATKCYPGGGEATGEVEKRATKAVQAVLENFPDARNIAIVAHGRTNKILLASLLSNDVLQSAEVKQGNTCINVLDYDEDSKQWTARVVNYIEHVRDSVIIR